MAHHVARTLASGARSAAFADLFRDPVPGLAPVGALRYPGVTFTFAEPERFVASLRRRGTSNF